MPEARNLGLGKALFSRLGQIAEEKVEKLYSFNSSIELIPYRTVHELIGQYSR